MAAERVVPSVIAPAKGGDERRAAGPSRVTLETQYEAFSIGDLAGIRNLLRGGSVIDWHRVYFTDRAEVDRFLRVNELDPESAPDMGRLDDLRSEAVEYLERHLGFRLP